jgi:hypothetical protein
VSKTSVLRIRWFDAEPVCPQMPLDWRLPALVMATLFLNFQFWYVHGLDFPLYHPVLLHIALLVAGTLLITALFFIGPALATQATRRPLLEVAARTLGVIPAYGLRLCCAVFLLLWIALSITGLGLRLVAFTLNREVSSTEFAIGAGSFLVFLFLTGLQSLRTSAMLAKFTNKLGIAILIAASIRVHDGWHATLKGFPVFAGKAAVLLDFWHGASILSFGVAPLIFLGANYGLRCHGRKQIAMLALMGIVLPLFGTLLFLGIINVATSYSWFYRPSLNPNIAMALWSRVARSAMPGLMMLVMITMFGAVRFGARALAEAVSVGRGNTLRQFVLPACFIAAIVWCSLNQDAANVVRLFEITATCLTVAAAVLTADSLTRQWRTEPAPRIDAVGLIALLTGLATPFCLPYWTGLGDADSSTHPWLLPSYGVAFLVCLLGRLVTLKTRIVPTRS